jgi:hypothetical protein
VLIYQTIRRNTPDDLAEEYRLLEKYVADHSGHEVKGVKCLRPLKHWDREFEPHSRHGYVSAFTLCMCCLGQVEVLRRTDPPSKGSYQLSVRSIISELILNGKRSEGLIHQRKKEEQQ